MPFYSRTPPIIKVRRAEPVDIPHIEKLMYQPQTYNFFGETDLHRLLEMAYLSLVQQNSRGDIITFISLCQHPNISSIPKWDWGSWLHGLYRLENVTLRNTLYIHMLLWHPRYSYTFLKSLLRTIFLSCVFVKNIILIVPPRVVPSLIIDEFFTQVFPVMEIPDPTLDLRRMQKIRLCVRQSLVPKLKIRYAVEEDHDDLVPILNNMTDRLREFYGEFYLAELIAYPTEQRKVIVAEAEKDSPTSQEVRWNSPVNNVAVGLACLNADINLEVLNENFELAPFYGLRCVDENDQFPLPEAELADSRERLHEISVIYSDDSISKLAPLDTLYEESDLEASSDEIMPESYSDDSGSDDIIIFEDTASTMILRHFYDDDDETDRDTLDESVQEFVRLHAREISSDHMTSVTDFFTSEKTLVQHHGTHHTEEKAQVLKIPTYNGAHNAFSIDLFGLRQDYDERQAFDFLEAAFECFPNMDFCLLTVPSTFPVFPLLQHFVRLTPRPLRTFNHEVFVTHRDAILGELDVRPATRSDITAVTQLIGSIQQNEAIRIDLLAALNNEKSTLMAYVMTCENNVVAVAILTRLDNPEYIRANYAMEDFIRFEHHRLSEHGRIKHLVMCPVFQMHGNHFLRQLMRMSDFNCLYYTQFPCENIIPEELRSTPITVIGELIPVAPRPLIEYHASSLEVNMPDPEIISQPIEYPFSLYFMSKRYSSKYKVAVNDHIVIVGASLTSLSFLETLVFGPWSKYLSFNNLTLVSPHGLPGDKSHHSARDFMIPYFGRFSSTHLAQLSLRTWVNVVYGALTGINRAKKYIQISGENMVQYDYLILLCPEQFQKPYPTSRRENVISDVGDCVRHAILKPMEDLVEYPQNVFLINSEVDATNSLTILKHLISHRTNYNIIVYGHCFEAFSCIAALQEFGIPNKNITFVEPFPIEPHSVSVFNDVDLDECVLEGIKNDGITVYSFYYFTGWELKLKHAKVTKVMFESKTKAIALDCIAMFYYGERGLSMRTFQAIIRSSLVFDGRLVIDREFRTNDHSIYAAGAFTKYKRKYYSEYLSHRFFNCIEVGQEMAMYLMQKWDPTFYKDLCVLPPSPLNRWRPYFNKPLVYACRLPGGMRYLSITRPGKPIPVETAMVQDDYGQVFVTGNCKRGERYFRIHFNNNWCVENITCYCNQDIDIHNLMCLYGKHEKLLNNLVERFETGQISDFYDYFREPWAYAVFQDRFNLMQMETHQIIKTVKEVKGPQIILEVLRAMDVVNSQKLQKIPDEKRTEILKHYRRTWEEELVTDRLLGFLYKNGYHLPMYVHPDRLKQILGEYLTPSEENKD